MKKEYSIRMAEKSEVKNLLEKYHYLSKIQNGFKSGHNFVLCKKNLRTVLGVCIFTGFPVPELSKGMFGLNRDNQRGLFELSRLCLEPEIQKTEHNMASWFVAKCIRYFRKLTEVKCILSYADSDFHTGTVYKALGFKYYGLSAAKKDFYILQTDGSYRKHSRGKIKGLDGEWRPRSQKHRYVKIFDKELKNKMMWAEESSISTGDYE